MEKEPKVVVTGGSGALGQVVTEWLVHAGYSVLSLDRRPHPNGYRPAWSVDLLDVGEIYEACRGAWGVVHLAAHIAPGFASESRTFNDNVRMTDNVLRAAMDMGVRRCVLASSTAIYGHLYGVPGVPPQYLPIDERHPCNPVDSYGISKLVGETIANAYARKHGASIYSLRFPGINYDPAYERILRLQSDPSFRAPGFWAYVDVRDAALAVQLALEKGEPGHHVYNIACDTSNMHESTAELIQRYFPTLADAGRLFAGRWSGVDSRAAKVDLGFVARHRWEDVA